MYHYSIPPPGYVLYDYTTSTATSPSASDYNYYIPQYKTPTASPTAPRGSSKRHSRKVSQEAGGYSYSTPRGPGGWHSPAGYPSPGYHSTMPEYASPPQKADYVSNSERTKSKSRRFWSSGTGGNDPRRRASGRSQKQHIYVDVVDDADDSPTDNYRYREPAYQKRYGRADDYFYYNHQVPIYAEDDSQPTRSRARRPSHPTRTTPVKPAKPAPAAKPTPKATAEDARKAGIPAGYSIKNWDPTESPIILLGSVFDANSLGKWIYDWTVFHHGPATPMSEVAGDMWLLLIKLAGKMKRAEECLPRIRRSESHDMVEDFVEGGIRLMSRLKKLLKACEEFMWKVAKREGGKGVSMGKNSGCEFVDSMFGRDRELENTERLMTSIRLWCMRFDTNCEAILRRPAAA
ncbi:hypothetical protein MMC16_005395 [Acarospora aff. strigata]|nr:hypothetical protein [Acarospora aff. strigata]